MNRTIDAQEAGYTLLQMAIALLVISVLFSSFAGLYYQYRAQLKVTETYANLETGISSISSFYANQGRVPCPASMTAIRGTAAYGAASLCTTGTIAALTPGQCTAGICVEDTVRTDLTGTDRRVIVGAIPFRDLQIPEEKSFDGYGSRLVYVVTMSATDNATYSNLKGAIAIRDPNGASLVGLDGSALYAVISPGQTMVGAYGKDGGLSLSCPTGAGSPRDAENCNVGFETGTAASTQSVYTAAEKSLAAGATFFDDDLSYFANTSEPTWRRTTAEPESIEDLSDNFVGAGTTTPGVDLDIASTGTTDSVRVYGQNSTDGTLLTDQICDETGANCFNTLAIAGDNTIAGEGMKCPVLTKTPPDPVDAIYMVGIENGIPKCVRAVEIECPPGMVLKGFVGQSAECVVPPVVSCAATTATLCDGTTNPVIVNLPNGADGAYFPSNTTFAGPAGDDNCYMARYRCIGTTWTLDATQGTCKAGIVSPMPTVYAACKDFLGHSGDSNGSGIMNFGWNNDVLSRSVSACTAAGYTYQYDVSACTCKDNDTRVITNLACPAPYTGVNARKITYTAQCELIGNPVNAANLVPRPDLGAAVIPNTPRRHFGLNAGAPDDSACACPDSPGWVFDYCPSGFRRKVSPIPASFVAPPASWPADITQGKSKHKYVDAACVVTYDAAWNDQCVCDTSKTYSHNLTTCTDPVCEQPKTNDTTIPGYPGAGVVQEGWDVFENSRNPLAGCTVTNTQIKTGTCQAKGFTWVESHTNGDAYVVPPANESGKACSCSDHIATTSSTVPCFRPADASKTMYFCKCQ